MRTDVALEIEETPLPGVGMRYSFASDNGDRVSVLHHHGGHREVFVGDPSDPDVARLVLELTDDDSRILAELLGTSRVVLESDRVQQSVAGLSIEWAAIPEDSPVAGRSIGDLDIRSSTDLTVVAALRRGEALPAPGPEFRLEAGDTLVVMGRRDDVGRVHALLRG